MRCRSIAAASLLLPEPGCEKCTLCAAFKCAAGSAAGRAGLSKAVCMHGVGSVAWGPLAKGGRDRLQQDELVFREGATVVRLLVIMYTLSRRDGSGKSIRKALRRIVDKEGEKPRRPGHQSLNFFQAQPSHNSRAAEVSAVLLDRAA